MRYFKDKRGNLYRINDDLIEHYVVDDFNKTGWLWTGWYYSSDNFYLKNHQMVEISVDEAMLELL